MKRLPWLVIVALLLSACSSSGTATLPPPTGPTGALPQPPPGRTPEATTASLPAPTLEPAGAENAYWVTNPTSGARLYVQAFYPRDWNGSGLLPALVLMPGGIGQSDPQRAARLSGEGFIVVIFDADGRGRSEGTEDYNGFVTQDGLAAVILAAQQLPGLDATRYGLVSYSYGVTAATGALARYPDLPIDFYIDWEGPVDRFYTTVGCGSGHSDIAWQPCSDDDWWAEREAVTFIGRVRVPYQRIQSEDDHVQPNNNHAIDIVNAAVAGGVPWVRLNDREPNQTYDTNNPPPMLPEVQDRRLEVLVAEYARYIVAEVLPAIP